MSHADKMAEFSRREKEQLAMGGANKLAARRAAGKLNVRERLEIFFDPGTFREIGVFSRSSRPEAADRSPTDGKIIGSGKVEGRSVLAVANDMTVLGASSAATNMKKIEYIRSLSCDKGLPLVFLGESTGARIPDSMGALGMAQAGQNPAQYRRLRQAPWISALLGPCYGSSAWYTAVSDVSVMLKGAVMAVSSPKVTKVALGEETDPQELGGLKLHSEVTGMADLAAESEEEALGLVRRTLSFLPTHAQEPPPLAEPAPPGGDQEKILDLLPQESHQVYEVRKIIRTLADKGEFLELKPKFARPCVTALARLEGRTVGLVANNPAHGAGALTADCCDKVISFLVLCDSFNIPLVMLVDTPGFLIGKAGERQKVVGRIMNWMNALSLVTVPIVSVIMGKSYGQAYLNMAGGKYSSAFAAWPTARLSFMGPEPAVNVVHSVRQEEDPQRFKELLGRMERNVEPWDAAGIFGLHDIIDPAQTREYLVRMLELHTDRLKGGIGQHLLCNWPTTF